MSGPKAVVHRLLIAAVLWLAALTSLEASARSANEEGNRLYRQKKYAAALKRYTAAQLEAPDEPRLHYNLGNVFFRQGEPEKARDEYARALASADPRLDPSAVYNLGNTFLEQQKYQEAVSAYQRTLKLNPRDRDAKRNLELALLRLRQQKQPPQGGGNDQKEQKPPSQQKKEQPSPGQGKRGDAKEKKQPHGGADSLSHEEAERILDALQEDEKANLKARLQAAKENQQQVEKDW
jgi:Ca-activated chloride channel homolog